MRGCAADRGRKWRIHSTTEITWFCLQHSDTALITTNSLDILVGVLYVCCTAFSPWGFVFYFFGIQQRGSPAVLSHWTDFLLRFCSPGGEIPWETSEAHTRTFVFTHTPPPENVWRISGAHCLSERSTSSFYPDCLSAPPPPTVSSLFWFLVPCFQSWC